MSENKNLTVGNSECSERQSVVTVPDYSQKVNKAKSEWAIISESIKAKEASQKKHALEFLEKCKSDGFSVNDVENTIENINRLMMRFTKLDTGFDYNQNPTK